MPKDFSNYGSSYPLGIRQNNPGDLRTGTGWMGEVSSDNGFALFKDLSYGLRALAVDLSNKIKEGYDTITEIITRYAPPSENDTFSYIESVSAQTGWNQDQVIEFNYDNLSLLMRAIITHELGQQYADLISDDDITEGIQKMPQSIIDRVKDFFASNPVIATVAGYGGIVAIIIIAIIIIALVSKKKIKIPSYA